MPALMMQLGQVIVIPDSGVTVEPSVASRAIVQYSTLSGQLGVSDASAVSCAVRDATLDFMLRKSIDDFVKDISEIPEGPAILASIQRDAEKDGVDDSNIGLGQPAVPFSPNVKKLVRVLERYGMQPAIV
jgi:hypothetical protein